MDRYKTNDHLNIQHILDHKTKQIKKSSIRQEDEEVLEHDYTEAEVLPVVLMEHHTEA